VVNGIFFFLYFTILRTLNLRGGKIEKEGGTREEQEARKETLIYKISIKPVNLGQVRLSPYFSITILFHGGPNNTESLPNSYIYQLQNPNSCCLIASYISGAAFEAGMQHKRHSY
jgi:hypothetical protein